MVRSGWKITLIVGAVLAISACSSKDKDAAAINNGGATTQTANTGAVAGATPGSVEDFVINVGDRVFFETDQYTLNGQAQNTLGLQAQWLQQNAGASIMVEGHADERGTREYNLALAERRATSVRNFLISQGIQSGRVQTVSYGKERPVESCSNDSCWRVNRRGVTVISGVPTS